MYRGWHQTKLEKLKGYKSYHTPRPGGYGGVAIYVNCNIPSVLLSDYCLCDDIVELCTVKIDIGDSRYIVSSLYRPHDKHQKVSEFTSFMDNFLSQNIFTDNQTIISGDFNINLLEHETHPPTKPFHEHNAISRLFPPHIPSHKISWW